MHRDTPSCATHDAAARAAAAAFVGARPASTPASKHTARGSRARLVPQRLQAQRTNDSDAIAKGCPLHLSHPGPIAHIRTPLHTCFILACVAHLRTQKSVNDARQSAQMRINNKQT